MKYWDEMRSKWGFDDGAAVPDDAEACRKIYVRAINRLCEKFGVPVRAEAFDRSGVHNDCLIILNNLDGEEITKHLPPEWDKVFIKACEMDLDGYVQTEVTVDEDEVTDLFTNHPDLIED